MPLKNEVAPVSPVKTFCLFCPHVIYSDWGEPQPLNCLNGAHALAQSRDTACLTHSQDVGVSQNVPAWARVLHLNERCVSMFLEEKPPARQAGLCSKCWHVDILWDSSHHSPNLWMNPGMEGVELEWAGGEVYHNRFVLIRFKFSQGWKLNIV